ncbi:hypothetical protein TNCV_626771 [Trichonephila clavipes]|nr:hypothetical protein TNCV_626771 [Trichonephila clavipes]
MVLPVYEEKQFSRSAVGQKLPDDWEKQSDDFLTFCKQIIVENNFTEDLIFSMDEVPLSFDIPPTRTVDVQGARLFAAKTAADNTPLRIIYRKIWYVDFRE